MRHTNTLCFISINKHLFVDYVSTGTIIDRYSAAFVRMRVEIPGLTFKRIDDILVLKVLAP